MPVEAMIGPARIILSILISALIICLIGLIILTINS